MDRRELLRAGLALSTVGTAGCRGLLPARRGGGDTGGQDAEQVTNRLQVLEASGLKTYADPDDEIGGVELVATKAPGAADITLDGITIQWVDDSGTYDLLHERVFDGGVDGTFAHEAIKDTNESLREGQPVIDSGDDRAVIVIDLDNPESRTAIAAAYDTPPGERATIRAGEGGLPEGATATLRITTQSGTASIEQLTVPESCSCKTAMRL